MSFLDKSTRREFMTITSSAVLGVAVPLADTQPDAPVSNPPSVSVTEEIPYSSQELFDTGPQPTFSGNSATQIAMPLGGIGAGCICLNGYGGLQDFSIWNHPATTALPEGYAPSKAAFAILHIKGASPVTKLVEGPFPVLKIYDQGLQGEGYRRGGFEGFPRFEKCDRISWILSRGGSGPNELPPMSSGEIALQKLASFKNVMVDESLTSGRGEWRPNVVQPPKWLRYED